MPRERRIRTTAVHQPSVVLKNRSYAVQDNAVQQIQIGSAVESSGNQILESLSTQEPSLTLKKKEKHALKREAFMKKLDAGSQPYSKSHSRREKRKARDQIGGGLDEIKLAISAISALEGVEDEQEADNPDATSSNGRKAASHAKPAKIGEGKPAPLSKAQRKKALMLERLRHPLILANSDYSANPFQTIRAHAQNTLIKHQVLTDSSGTKC